VQPYLRGLLHQLRISRGDVVTYERISAEKPGNVVNQLIQMSTYPDYFEFAPWGVRVNQWRNIAQHHSVQVEDPHITCFYGDLQHKQSVTLTRAELLILTKKVMSFGRALKLSTSLYFLDNVSTIRSLGIMPKGLKVPREAITANLQLQLASQGFDLVYFDWTPTKITAVIQELSDADPTERRIHTTQFPSVIWQHTDAPLVEVEYRERDGTPNFRTIARGDDCQACADGEIDYSELVMKRLEMSDLRTAEEV